MPKRTRKTRQPRPAPPPKDRKTVPGSFTALYVRRVPWDVAHELHQAALDRGTTTAELLAHLVRTGLRPRGRRPRR